MIRRTPSQRTNNYSSSAQQHHAKQNRNQQKTWLVFEELSLHIKGLQKNFPNTTPFTEISIPF